MIQQDRFLRLLEAADEYEANHQRYRQAIAHVVRRIREGSMTAQAGIDFITGFDMQYGNVLSRESITAIAEEKAHFKANAKRNAKNRQRVRLKKDLKAHNEHKAQRAMPWVGTLPKATPVSSDAPPVFKHIPQEELERLQAEQEGKYEQALAEIAERQAREGGPSVSPHIAEARRRLEELAAKQGYKVGPSGGLIIPDDEILGDTDGTEDPFA